MYRFVSCPDGRGIDHKGEGGEVGRRFERDIRFYMRTLLTHISKCLTQYPGLYTAAQTSEVEQDVAVQSVIKGRLHCQEGLSKSSNEHLQSPKQKGVQ